MVIPGHGRLCDEADVVEYRDMMTIIRDRIQDLVKKGMTLEQVKAARPDAGLRSLVRAVGCLRRGGVPELGGSGEEVMADWRYSVIHAFSTNNASRTPGGSPGWT